MSGKIERRLIAEQKRVSVLACVFIDGKLAEGQITVEFGFFSTNELEINLFISAFGCHIRVPNNWRCVTQERILKFTTAYRHIFQKTLILKSAGRISRVSAVNIDGLKIKITGVAKRLIGGSIVLRLACGRIGTRG